MRIHVAYPLGLLLFSLTVNCSGASPDGWSEVDKNVRNACAAKVREKRADYEITIEHYGQIAIATGVARWAGENLSFVCVYDGRTKTANARRGDISKQTSQKLVVFLGSDGKVTEFESSGGDPEIRHAAQP